MLALLRFNYRMSSLEIENTGHTIQVNLDYGSFIKSLEKKNDGIWIILISTIPASTD